MPHAPAELHPDRPRIGVVAVRRDPVRSHTGDRLCRSKETLGRDEVAVLAEHDVDQRAITIDRDGSLVDVMLSEHRNLVAAKRFLRSAKAVTGVTPDRVTTDGHDAYPRAIRMELGGRVRHRTNRYLNNRLEQDHRGIKGRCRPMLG